MISSLCAGCGGEGEAVLEQWQSCERPLILGHRGTRQGAPENTLPAFQWALENGADGIEVDIKKTRDNVLVAFHDETTGRTTDDALDREISQMGFGQLRLLDAGGWFGDSFRRTRVPTLREVLNHADDARLIDIDHLSSSTIDDVKAVLDDNPGVARRVIVSSFDEEALGRAAERMPDVPRVLFLGDTALDELQDKLDEQAAIAHPDYVRVPKNIEEDPRALAKILEAGFRPAMSGSKVQWVGGIVFADDAAATRRRIDDRKPFWCE